MSLENGKNVLLMIDSTSNSAELMALRIERLNKQNKVTGTSFSPLILLFFSNIFVLNSNDVLQYFTELILYPGSAGSSANQGGSE